MNKNADLIGEQAAKAATPAADLERQIMSPNVLKNEREWWAHHEIERLREALAKAARVPPAPDPIDVLLRLHRNARHAPQCSVIYGKADRPGPCNCGLDETLRDAKVVLVDMVQGRRP